MGFHLNRPLATFVTACAAFILSVTVTQAQAGDLAVVLEVVYGGVELQRADTVEWKPLLPGAVMPAGAGDRIRTATDGRVLLTLDAANAEILVLPNTVFQIETYTDGSPPTFAGTVFQGDTVHQVRGMADYTVRADGTPLVADVSSNAQVNHLLVSSREGADTLLVAAGTIGVGDDEIGEDMTLFVDAERREVLSELSPPYNPASVIGLLDGCAATIVTSDGQNLNARIGPGTANLQLGQFPDQAAGRVMGLVQAGGWYRVQFRSGFGWVERLAVIIEDSTCPLPTLPDDAFDLPSTIFNVSEREQALLQPFYGTPEDDPIFYQFASDN
jgi:hypothetical protein